MGVTLNKLNAAWRIAMLYQDAKPVGETAPRCQA